MEPKGESGHRGGLNRCGDLGDSVWVWGQCLSLGTGGGRCWERDPGAEKSALAPSRAEEEEGRRR